MIFRQLFDTTSSTYTYLLADEDSRKALLIDPVVEKTAQYLQLLNELDLQLELAIDTHTHADHITALGELRERCACRTMIGAESKSQCASATFTDGDILKVGNINVLALHTPGHTDDSYSFVVQESNQTWLFTGDTLLIRGTGRTDFQNGNAFEQFDSLWNKLLRYSDDTIVYPAHDYKGWMQSTVGEEKRNNPRLAARDATSYAGLMASLKLPNPKLMDIAVPANRACGKI